jgi:hypothetical protein
MNYYGNNLAQGIDLRVEFDKILFGAFDFVSQGRQMVLREFNDTPCPACWDSVTKSSRLNNCPYCQGEAYQFTERVLTMALYPGIAPVYKPGVQGTGQYPTADYGSTDPDRASAYCRYDTWPNYERFTLPQNEVNNKLYELKVDFNGNTVQPMVRASKWKVLSVTPYHGDFGRVEFFELGLERETIA